MICNKTSTFLFTFFLLVLFSFNTIAQSKKSKKTDIINVTLSKIDSVSYKKMVRKFIIYINPNPDSSLYYINKIRNFSIQKNYIIGQIQADYFQANYYRRIQNFEVAIIFFKKSSLKSSQYNYKRGVAVAQNGLCRVYYFLGDNKNALINAKKGLLIASEINNLSILTDTYSAIGNIYFRQNKLKLAINSFLKADSIHTKTPQRLDIIAGVYQGIGRIYTQLKDYDKSENFLLKARKELKKIGNNAAFFLHNTNIHLAINYFHKGNLLKSDSVLQRCYTYFYKIKERSALAETCLYLGKINLKQNNIVIAEKFLKESYSYYNTKKYGFETSKVALELGNLYLSEKKINRAIKYFNKVLPNTDNTFIKNEFLEKLATAYALNNNFNIAYKKIKEANSIRDSLTLKQNITKIKEIEIKYESEKKEQKIKLLEFQNQLAKQKQKNQRNFLIIALFFIFFLILFFFYLYKNKQKTTTKLQELNRLKSTFFANISHEFRTPITLVSGLANKYLDDGQLDKELVTDFNIIEQNSNRLLNLVDQLLDLSKIESNNFKLKISNGNLSFLLDSLCTSFKHIAIQKKITYTIKIERLQNVWFDKEVIEKIIINLLSNAFKYTKKGGGIHFSAKQEESKLLVVLENSSSISKEEIVLIFNRFYQSKKESSGVGIGLSLVKKLTTIHKGKIEVNNTENATICFKVNLSISKSDFKSNEISTEILANNLLTSEQQSTPKNQKLKGKKQIKKLPIMLIIEDNKDVRYLIKQSFENEYQIMEAENGEEGISKAFNCIPDIIISDIMMPKINGYKVSNTLKQDSKTSHIPILLLTAKTEDISELRGIKTGADAYLKKPINIKLLKAHIFNVLKIRNVLRSKYSKNIIIDPKEIAVTSVDEKFLNRVKAIFDKHLTEPAFNSNQFSNLIDMNRIQLYRKLKALTGLSSTEFIKSQRLILSTKLLKKSKGNVSEIAYKVGFNNHAYFSKCFKETYSCTPSEFILKNK